MQRKLLTVGLILSLVANGLLGYFALIRDAVSYKTNYTELKSSYLALADSQRYLLEVLLKAPEQFQSLMPEYKNVSQETFSERIRRKIVKLEMEVDELQEP